ncbi:hypothetical protein F5887DRAFT_159461 [Amanita rubescens]|nr:hypothetical protein F5887DRAFT_159461 [Amanita rubescens]
MAATTGAPSLISDADETHVQILKERYLCPHFRILVIGRANAGKTTILEKVCGVAKGTKPIIYDMDGNQLEQSMIHLMPSVERGLHDIEHQITYPGSNFIFHDSRGFESGSTEELEIAWKFIERKSVETELKNQLHAIWYCIPMDSPRPILSAELEFFNKGTGKVPLVVIFTKFDGQINIEFANLTDAKNEDKWERAREIAQITFQNDYLPKVLDAKCPPKAYVQLEDMDLPEKNCAELTQQTADAINDDSIHQLFVSTQMNNLDLCVKSALQHVLKHKHWTWDDVILIVFGKFPHFWVDRVVDGQ